MADMWPLIHEVFEGGGRFRLFPRGSSMLPLIRPEKDSVLLEPPSEIKKHDILLYRRANGQFVLHRLMFFEGEDLVMCGDHQVYLERHIPREAVLARVAGIYFDEKYLVSEHPSLRRYARRRAFSRPFRRIFSAIKRRIF